MNGLQRHGRHPYHGARSASLRAASIQRQPEQRAALQHQSLTLHERSERHVHGVHELAAPRAVREHGERQLTLVEGIGEHDELGLVSGVEALPRRRGEARAFGQLGLVEGRNIVVEFAMRYGNPSTKSGIDALQAAGCQKILLAPLYPQYSATTTATANDKAFDALKTMRWQPAIRTLPAYFDEQVYIETLAQSIADGVAALDFTPDLILTSYHGMPVEYLEKGDPYHCQCLKTTRLVREHLGWSEEKLKVTFQSRFGPTKWLEPYTDATLMALPAQGVKRVAVVAPAFSADCIETLEEIAITGREQFEHAGGERYAYIPCLNDSELGMTMLESVIRKELQGWV